MKLRAIRLNNVRRFTDPVEVRGITPGLNVLAAPNEHGKSTIFDALHAVFFRDRKSFDKRIRSLVPHAGDSPQVEVEIEHDGGAYRIEKTFKRGAGTVRVLRGGSVFRQADAAEEWIRSVLKAPERGGPAGLLWVRQGQANLHSRDKRENEHAQLARRNLLTSVASEVDAMTGGRRMEVARSRCRSELAKYLTGSGREKKGGPLAGKRQEASSLEERRAELQGVVNKLRSALANRRRLQRELDEWLDPGEARERAARLKAAEEAHAQARRHKEQRERALEKESAKLLEVKRMRERCDALLKDVLELAEAGGAHEIAKRARKAASDQLDADKARLQKLDRKRKEAIQEATHAEAALRRALRKESVEAQRQRRSELQGRLEQAQEARRAGEKAQAEEDRELAPHAAEELEQQDAQVRALRRSRDREAAAVTMSYLPGKGGAVRIGDRVLEDGVRVSVPEGAEFDIDGIGRLELHPDLRVDNASLEESLARLHAMLRSFGLEDIEEARASLGRRRAAAERRRDAEAMLKGVAPRGIEALQDELAALPEEKEAEEEGLPLEEARSREEEARAALDAAAGAFERQRERSAEAERLALRGAAALDAAEARLRRVKAALQGLESPEDEVQRREQACVQLSRELEALAVQRRAMEQAAPNLEELASRLERTRSVVDTAREEEERLRLELRGLETFIEIQAGNAVEEELADTSEQLAKAEEELEAIVHETKVLRRLDEALTAAQESARDRYVRPVLRELVPLIRLLWPDAEIRFDAENVLPEALVRAGTEESFNVLSGGTQEQIAILVRLAFAQILAKSGRPAPAILDDAIVYTDDDRIEAVFDALTQQARDLQIIVLSCRQRAFRELGGTSLRIEPVVKR